MGWCECLPIFSLVGPSESSFVRSSLWDFLCFERTWCCYSVEYGLEILACWRNYWSCFQAPPCCQVEEIDDQTTEVSCEKEKLCVQEQELYPLKQYHHFTRRRIVRSGPTVMWLHVYEFHSNVDLTNSSNFHLWVQGLVDFISNLDKMNHVILIYWD